MLAKPMKAERKVYARGPGHLKPIRYGTFEVARMAGVTVRTVYNWLREGKLPEPMRAANGYRLWTSEQVALAIKLGSSGRPEEER